MLTILILTLVLVKSLEVLDVQKIFTQCNLGWSTVCRDGVGTLKRLSKSDLESKVWQLITQENYLNVKLSY